MAALLHIDLLRQHTLSPVIFSDLGLAAATLQATPHLRPVAGWQIGPNGRPVCNWNMDVMANCVPPD